jgi:hypothetical protein
MRVIIKRGLNRNIDLSGENSVPQKPVENEVLNGKDSGRLGR